MVFDVCLSIVCQFHPLIAMSQTADILLVMNGNGNEKITKKSINDNANGKATFSLTITETETKKT